MNTYIENDFIIYDEVKAVLEEHRIIPFRIQKIGGDSLEPKYCVETISATYFVKISKYNLFTRELLNDMHSIQELTGVLSLPCITQNISSINRQVNIYHWIKGDDLKSVIGMKSEQECYQIGSLCGKMLWQIHTATKQPTDTYNIDETINKSLTLLMSREDLLIHKDVYFRDSNRWSALLKRTHLPTIVHMDYKPKNIMLSGKKYIVVDWDSCAIADPWMDFFDKGLALHPKRQAFNTGVIDGYFNGTVPQEFWLYFKALSIFALVLSAAWGVKRNNTKLINVIEQHLWDSYYAFKLDIPTWYSNIKTTIL